LPAPVLRPENPMELNAYPNPARDHVTYAFVTDKEGDYRLRVCDMAGRELYRTVRQAWEGDNSDDLSLSGLTPGVYVLILEQGPVSGQFRIAVQ